MKAQPEALTIGATPQKLTDIVAIGQKASVHVKSSSPASVYVYLTEANPEALTASAYTHEIAAGGLYETPTEHVGEVWVASSSSSSSSFITATKYG